MTYLPTDTDPRGIYSYSEITWVKTRSNADVEQPDSCMKEASPGVLRFFSGMGVSSLEETIGETSLSYARRLRTMPRGAINAWLTRNFYLNRKVTQGKKVLEEDRVLLFPNNKVFVYDTVKTPKTRDKKVVGFVAENRESGKTFTPEEVLDFYKKAYADDKDGAVAFAKNYQIQEFLDQASQGNPKRISFILSDLIDEYSKSHSLGDAYKEQTKRSIRSEFVAFLRQKGVTKKEVAEILMENHRRSSWRASSSLQQS